MLDEAGYLVGDLGQVAELLGCPVERVEATLAAPAGVRSVRHFRPVAARVSGACSWRTAAGWMRRCGPAARISIWSAGATGRRWCGVRDSRRDSCAQCVAEIRTLNPKPALVFDYAIAQPVMPDVIMRPQPNGGWVVELNSETLPRVLVNNHLLCPQSAGRLTAARTSNTSTNACSRPTGWSSRCTSGRPPSSRWQPRSSASSRSSSSTASQSLRPLVLRDIAEAIGMHESTVSRVTSNKFVATPRGIFELKYFFTHAVGGGRGGDAHSAESVRHRIKKIIDGEPAEGFCPTSSRRGTAKGRHRHRPPHSRQISRGHAAFRRRCSGGGRRASAMSANLRLDAPRLTPTVRRFGRARARDHLADAQSSRGDATAMLEEPLPRRLEVMPTDGSFDQGQGLDVGDALRGHVERGTGRRRRQVFRQGARRDVTSRARRTCSASTSRCTRSAVSSSRARERRGRRLLGIRQRPRAHRQAAPPLQAPPDRSPTSVAEPPRKRRRRSSTSSPRSRSKRSCRRRAACNHCRTADRDHHPQRRRGGHADGLGGRAGDDVPQSRRTAS